MCALFQVPFIASFTFVFVQTTCISKPQTTSFAAWPSVIAPIGVAAVKGSTPSRPLSIPCNEATLETQTAATQSLKPFVADCFI